MENYKDPKFLFLGAKEFSINVKKEGAPCYGLVILPKDDMDKKFNIYRGFYREYYAFYDMDYESLWVVNNQPKEKWKCLENSLRNI